MIHRTNTRLAWTWGLATFALLGCAGADMNGGKGVPPSNLTYTELSPVYQRGHAITANAPTVSGDPVKTYSIAPALPTGLSLDATTGVITGTPTVILAATTFTVTAANDAGQTTATLQVTVVDAPTLSYAGATGTTGTVGSAMSVAPTTLQDNGRAISGCLLAAGSSPLPAGLGIGFSSCVISGTPTVATTVQVSVVAVNALGDSAPASVTLTIQALPPVLSYAGATGTTGTVGAAMTIMPTTLTTNGASVTACAVKASTPALPAGLAVDATTCVISGTPTAPAASATYTLVASNAAGPSADAPVTLTVTAAVPTLSYAGATGTTGAVGSAMTVTPTTLSANGAPVTACTAAPLLPAGLSLNPSTCVISGNPTTATATANYTIKATNSAGDSAGAVVTLTITDVPTLSYVGASGTTGVFGTAMSVTPTTLLDHGSPITGCAIKASTPALPAGLTVSATTCVISGTPTVAIAATGFTLKATNAVGASADANVTLTIQPAVPTLSFANATGTNGTFGVAMTVSPTSLLTNGASITNCVVTPALPSGLGLNPTTCVISGTPGVAAPATAYAVNAKNSAGFSADAFVTLTVNPAPPVLSYAGATGTAITAGVAANVAPTTLTLNGGAITNCAIKTSTTPLPAGLSVNPSTCVISGTASTTAASATYTIVATNAGGASADASVSLAVAAGAPTLSYAGAANTAGVVGTAMNVAPTTLKTNGSALTACIISGAPAKPAWMVIDPGTCVISGTPPGAIPATTFNVLATNGVGVSGLVPVTITVNISPAAPTLSYAGATGTSMRVGVAASISPTTLQANGAALTNCALSSGTFPAGLAVSPTTCVISGTPSALAAAASYTIVATNAQGPSTPASVTLTVGDVPSLSYAGATGTTGTVGSALSVSPTSLVTNNSALTGCAIKTGTNALPGTLSVNPTTCAITGTPTATLGSTLFTVVATNGFGASVDATVSLTINAAVPSLSFSGATGSPGTFGVLMTVAPTTLASNGASITACTITPSLPAGLSISPTSCVISGTPTAVAPSATYAVTATNGAGNSTPANVTLAVNAGLPTLSYAGATGTAMYVGVPATITPTALVANGAAVTACSIAPTIPAGLAINPTTCVISGTPTASTASRSYTITATNAAGPSVGSALVLSVTAPAVLTISDAPTYDFGSWGTGATSEHVFIVTNSGDLAATSVVASGLGMGFANKGVGFPGSGGTCGAIIPGGSACLFVLTFTPPGVGTFTRTIALAYNDGLQAQVANRALSGTGVATAALTITDFPPVYYTDFGLPADGSTFDFGTLGVGATGEHVFYVTNTGGANATVTGGGALSGGYAYKGGSFPGTGSTCGLAPLTPGGTCTVTVTLVAALGVNASSLVVNYTGGTSTSATRPLTATGATGAVLTLYDFSAGANGTGLNIGPSWNFGTVGLNQYDEHDFMVVNSGTATASALAAGTMPAGFSFPGGFPGGTPGGSANVGQGINFCTSTLGTGASCAIRVRFSPTQAQGYAGNATINFGSGQTATRPLTGTGSPYALVTIIEDTNRSGLTYDFGTVGVGSLNTLGFIVTNRGAQAATALGSVALGQGFAFTGGTFPGGTGTYIDRDGQSMPFCTANGSIAAGARCAVRVTFSPPAPGTFYADLSVTFGDGSPVVQTATRSLEGSGTDKALISIDCDACGFGGNPANAIDFGVRAAGSTNQNFILVRNTGAAAATLTPSSLTGSAFAYTGAAYPGGTGQWTYRQTSYPFCGPAPYVLAPGSACLVAVTYTAPNNSSNQSGVLTLETAGATSAQTVVTLVASSTTLAIVTLSDCLTCGSSSGPTSHQFGSVASGSTRQAFIFVSNRGASAATLSAGSMSGTAYGYTGGTYPGGTAGAVVNTGQGSYPFCPASGGTLSSGATCVLSISYAASGTMPQIGSLTVLYGGATTPSGSVALAGAPTDLAIISVRDCASCSGATGPGTPTHDFGSVASGTTTVAYFFITNSGNSTAQITNGGLTGSAYSFGAGFPGGPAGGYVNVNGSASTFCAAGGLLQPNTTCVVAVSYAASGSTPQSGSLSLNFYYATTDGTTYNLTAQPTTQAIVSLTSCQFCGSGGSGTPTYDFGTVAAGTSSSNYFFLRNSGSGAATITNTGISGAGFSYGAGYPGGTAGTTVNLNGATFAFCPSSGGTLAGGATCVLRVFYAASGAAPQSGALSLSYGGATTSGAAYDLKGTPTNLAIMNVTTCPTCGGGGGGGGTPTEDFGTVASGATFTKYFFVVNSGSSAGTVANAGFSGSTAYTWAGAGYPGGTAGSTVNVYGANYTYCPTSGGSLAGNSTCVLQVKYVAAGTTPQSATLTLGFTGATTASATYGLTASPTNLAIINIKDCVPCGVGSAPVDFGVAGTPIDKVLVVENTGNAIAGLADGASLIAPFGYATGVYPGGFGPTSVGGTSMSFCGPSLVPGARCAIAVRYSGASTATGTLTLLLANATAGTVVRGLTGSSTTRGLLTADIDPSWTPCTDATCGPVNYPATSVGSAMTYNFVISNRGGQNVTSLQAGTAFAAGFGYGPLAASMFPGGSGLVTIAGQSFAYCGGSLAKGAQCAVTVTFKPLMSGTVLSALNLAYSDASGGLPNASRGLLGTAP